MTETITQSRAEDAIATTNAFLNYERGASLDGDFASDQVRERVISVEERVEHLLTSIPHPQHDGLYVPLSQHNAAWYSEAAAVLPGHFVLVPSALVEPGTAFFYPAVVSEDGLKQDNLRLHVLKRPYHQQIGYGAATVLSAAGQSETPGIGDHGRKANDSVEAEHFATLLAAGSDPHVQASWRAGQHINHMWRNQPQSSVTTEVSSRLFGQEIPQTTVTITRQQIENGQAMLFWHESMRDEDGWPEAADHAGALVVVQGLGFEALRTYNPQAVDNVKSLIA